MSHWILISQPVQYTTAMAENSNCIAEGQKKLFLYRNSKFAGELKTRAMAETTSL